MLSYLISIFFFFIKPSNLNGGLHNVCDRYHFFKIPLFRFFIKLTRGITFVSVIYSPSVAGFDDFTHQFVNRKLHQIPAHDISLVCIVFNNGSICDSTQLLHPSHLLHNAHKPISIRHLIFPSKQFCDDI